MVGLRECRRCRGVFLEGILSLEGHRRGAAGSAFRRRVSEHEPKVVDGTDLVKDMIAGYHRDDICSGRNVWATGGRRGKSAELYPAT
jgi:hypothetical protein